MRTVDLNADMGEYGDASGQAVERTLLESVSSAHIACGGHAGTEETMCTTVDAAMEHGVRIGAHPSYPDRAGFGRRTMQVPLDQLARSLTEQIRALVDIAGSRGAAVTSVKPHGALYAEVAKGEDAYRVLVDAVRAHCAPGTALVLPAGADALPRAWEEGLRVFEEGFCDRAYGADGSLRARDLPGAVYGDPSLAAVQSVRLAAEGTVEAADGTLLHRHVDTLCIHSDSPNAPALAAAVRRALAEAGIEVAAAPAR
ncbi:MAG TPA: 5-oxoprolinase subunit PxpA [Acidimicrobiales bacterium]|nr:5-oxoprolinase subunit PxpA [Acidimicrobiales bacterium]